MPRSGSFRRTMRDYTAFFPAELPPEPPIQLDGELGLLLSKADRALGAINTIASILPNPELLVAMFIQKEALLSSQIEGTQSSMVDVLGAEDDNEPTEDVGEVVNYIHAMRFGLSRIRDDEFPMSLRLFREIHEILLTRVRGGVSALTPGEFRTKQNWIGGSNLGNARYIPPPPHEMQASLDNLEKYLHREDECPVLVRCALIHYQFETIHPFNDGNGRLGRLLITFYLVWREVLDEPMLYLSAYLKTHQQEYYDRLQQVRTDGTFEAWVKFFLEGIVTVSDQVVQTTKAIQALQQRDTDRVLQEGIGHAGVSLLRHLMEQPVIKVKDVEKAVGVSYSKANNLIAELEKLGILKQISKGKRNRKFSYREYVAILAEGTEPLQVSGNIEHTQSE